MAQNLKIEHYMLGKTLGIGAFGKVKLAKHEFSGNYVAIKIINKKRMKNNNMSAKIKREIKLLRYFNHPNIIRLYEVLETQTDIFVVMEYIQNGELFELIAQKGKLSEDEARYYFQQIIAGVEYCHTNLVAHRDLKPENILIAENNTVKIADFGLSNLMKDGKFLKTSCGSPNYAAPEVISGKKYCGTEIDTWSVGVILFAMIAGYLPFDEEVIPVLFKKIKEADYQMPPHFSPEAQDLVKKLLNPDTNLRMKFHEIKLHPWVQMNNSLYLKINNGGASLPSRLNEEILYRILRMGFNYEGFTEQKVREAILKRKDFSFVIAYDLMHDEYSKKQLTNRLMEKEVPHETKEEGGLENIKEALQEQYKMVNPEVQASMATDFTQWHYGLKFNIPPSTIMAGITEALLELDTAYIIKSTNFRIKCFHQLHKSSFAQQQAIEVENGELVVDSYKQPGQNGPTTTYKSDKYTKTEVVFLLQIYTAVPKKEYVVDIQRVKGHTLLFLQYSQKFISLLTKKLSFVKGY